MKKLILSGLGSNEEQKRSYFIFEKPDYPKAFNEFWERLGFGLFYYDEEGSIKEDCNRVNHFRDDKFDIDVVYTQDKIILIVRGEWVDLEKFKFLVFEYSKLIE